MIWYGSAVRSPQFDRMHATYNPELFVRPENWCLLPNIPDTCCDIAMSQVIRVPLFADTRVCRFKGLFCSGLSAAVFEYTTNGVSKITSRSSQPITVAAS